MNSAFTQINSLTATNLSPSLDFRNRPSTSLNGLNTQNNVAETFVINVTSGFQVSSKINITGDAGDVFILRWDPDRNSANGYQGQVKFQSGGAIVPGGQLTAGNFIHVAGDINASGGGSNPAAPYPQGPRYDTGRGSLIAGGKNFSGGGFFTGYWLTTGAPTKPADATHSMPYGNTAPLSNAIFVGGWYSITNGTRSRTVLDHERYSITNGTRSRTVLDHEQIQHDIGYQRRSHLSERGDTSDTTDANRRCRWNENGGHIWRTTLRTSDRVTARRRRAGRSAGCISVDSICVWRWLTSDRQKPPESELKPFSVPVGDCRRHRTSQQSFRVAGSRQLVTRRLVRCERCK